MDSSTVNVTFGTNGGGVLSIDLGALAEKTDGLERRCQRRYI